MWERTICGFRAGRRGCAASLLCRHINVIKHLDYFLSSIVSLEYGPLRSLEALQCGLRAILAAYSVVEH